MSSELPDPYAVRIGAELVIVSLHRELSRSGNMWLQDDRCRLAHAISDARRLEAKLDYRSMDHRSWSKKNVRKWRHLDELNRRARALLRKQLDT